MKKSRSKKHLSLTMIVISVLVIGLTAAGSYNYFKYHRALSISRNGVQLTVTKVSYDKAGSMPFEAPPGWKFVVVEVVVTNHSAATFNFAPVVQTILTTSAGNYPMSPAILPDPITAGPLRPQTKTSGTLSYLVPVDAKDISFQFQP